MTAAGKAKKEPAKSEVAEGEWCEGWGVLLSLPAVSSPHPRLESLFTGY